MQLRTSDSVKIISEAGSASFDTPCAQWADVTVAQELRGGELDVRVTANHSRLKYLRLRWNFSAAEKRAENVRILGDEWERGYGRMEWRGVVPERCMPWAFAVANGSDANPDPAGRLTECFGVKVRPGAMCFWQYDTQGVTLWLDVRNGGSGVLLGGRTLPVCTVTFAQYRDMSAFRAVRAYYKTLCDDALRPAQTVYGSNNWYYAYGKSSHEEILADTKFIAEVCRGAAVPPYMVIDDGWQPNPTDGPWHKGNERFPDMKGLCAQMKAYGVKPGIWIRYLNDEKRQTPGITPDMYLARDTRYLDPSHPAVLEKVAADTRRIVNDWGFQLIKHDFSTYDIFGFWGMERPENLAQDGWHFHDETRTSAEIVIDFYRTILQAAGPDTLILGCNVIGHLAAGLVHLNRTGDDTSGREWERTRKMGVNTLAFRMMHQDAFYDADADCIGITGQIEWTRNREWLRLLSLSGTPLFMSCKPGVLGEEELAELRAATVRNAARTDTLEPLDWMENVCPERWLHGGEEIRFNWYPAEGTESFQP